MLRCEQTIYVSSDRMKNSAQLTNKMKYHIKQLPCLVLVLKFFVSFELDGVFVLQIKKWMWSVICNSEWLCWRNKWDEKETLLETGENWRQVDRPNWSEMNLRWALRFLGSLVAEYFVRQKEGHQLLCVCHSSVASAVLAMVEALKIVVCCLLLNFSLRVVVKRSDVEVELP